MGTRVGAAAQVGNVLYSHLRPQAVEMKGWLCVNGHVHWCVLQDGRLQIHSSLEIPDINRASSGGDEDLDIAKLLSACGSSPDVPPPPFIVDSDVRHIAISPVPFELDTPAADAATQQPSVAFELVVVNADHSTMSLAISSNLVESSAEPELACQRGSFPADVRGWHDVLGRVCTATHNWDTVASIGMGVL